MTTQLATKTTMSQALASNGIKELCNSLSLTPEQVNRAKSTALELSSNPMLSKCDPFSLVKFCFETARYNFSRNDCIYPVPYGDKVQAQMGYKGFRELCLRSGAYRDINCSAVYTCDKVKRDRNTGKFTVDFEEDYEKMKDSKVIGYYAFALDKDGYVINSLFWTIEKCVEHGKYYSKSYNSIWGGREFEKMAKKTVLKQLCNELKTTPELQSALKLDQIVFGKDGEEDDYLDNPHNKNTFKNNKVNNTIVEESKEDECIRTTNDILDDIDIDGIE